MIVLMLLSVVTLVLERFICQAHKKVLLKLIQTFFPFFQRVCARACVGSRGTGKH